MKAVERKSLGKKKCDGEIAYVNWTQDGSGSRVSKDFLLTVILGVCSQSMRYWRELPRSGFDKSHPLRCHERQFYSTFASAISDVTPIHLSEMGIFRKSRGDDAKNGRADFWAHHRNHNFFIELKRTTIGIKTQWTKKNLKEKFSPVERQTLQLKREAGEWRDSGTGDCVVMGLQVILPFSNRLGRAQDNLHHFVDSDAQEHQDGLLNTARDLEKNVDFCAIWTPPPEARHFEYALDEKTRTEWNPYIGFVAKILAPGAIP